MLYAQGLLAEGKGRRITYLTYDFLESKKQGKNVTKDVSRIAR